MFTGYLAIYFKESKSEFTVSTSNVALFLATKPLE